MDPETLARYLATALTVDSLRYIVGAGGTWLLLDVALRRWLEQRRLHDRPVPKGQIGREIAASARTVLIFALIGTGLMVAEAAGCLAIYDSLGAYGTGWAVLSFVLFLVIQDAWFYWTHWLMHRSRLLIRIHRVHHLSRQPTAFAAYSFDAAEALVQAAFFPVVLALMPLHPLVIFLFLTHMMLRNAIGHSGVEVYPATRSGRPLLPFLTTVTHHDLHHAEPRWNLGLWFTWWDRWMGTEHPDYAARFRAAVSRPRTALQPPSAPTGGMTSGGIGHT